ncbi:MAG TPA: toll/interleukin-1 receptor domain-containing protein [Gemmatimonadaceae bacterium]|nr:toll/interleukin-1 receptor domain-containing protein [Gemmatimonadaceae bacterium]
MKIFLSYPSEERAVAERVNHALLGHGHDVFFDRADLEAGFEYDQAIARAIGESDLFVFFITPASVQTGRYTLTELSLAERRWPHAGGRVLPVMARPTDIAAVPAYLRAVNILTPRGDIAAETVHQVQRMERARRLGPRIWRQVRSPRGIVAAVCIVAVAALGWLAHETGVTRVARERLPADVRRHARLVAPLVDSGFAIATTSPPRLVQFTDEGTQVGAPLELMGEPVSITRTPSQLLIVTRGRDGIMAIDAKRPHVVDSALLDPSAVASPRYVVNPPRPSGDIESVQPHRLGLWVTTGDRDGEPTMLRYRIDKRWDVVTWTVDSAGFGREAMGVRLRRVGAQLWGARARGNPGVLYHFVDPMIRIDRFDGRERRIVACATDIAASPRGNPLFLSCDNALQEVSVQARQLTLERTWPPFPAARGDAGTSTHHLIEADSSGLVVAFNIERAAADSTPVRTQVFVLDSTGSARVLDEPRAAVRSLALTPRRIVTVLRRADGSSDVIVRPRRRSR